MERPTMAGIARDLALTIEAVLVQREHHLHHLARPLLWLLVILIEGALYMTVFATHSERRRHELHRRNNLIGRGSLQHLYVLINLFSGRWRLRRLRRQRADTQRQQNHRYRGQD